MAGTLGRPWNIACGQIDIGNADTSLAAAFKTGVPQARSSRDRAEIEPRSGPALVRRDRRRPNSLPPISVHLGSTLGQSISVHLGRLQLGCISAASRQANGEVKTEPTMDVDDVGRAVAYMACGSRDGAGAELRCRRGVAEVQPTARAVSRRVCRSRRTCCR